MYSKILAYFIFAIGFLTSKGSLFATNAEQKEIKIYLSKENVRLENNQILIGNSYRWVPIPHLSADQGGFFVTADKSNYSLFQWECSHCGHDNWLWENYCYFCGHER